MPSAWRNRHRRARFWASCRRWRHGKRNFAGRHAARLDDVEDFFVRREAEPVRTKNAFGDDGGVSGLAVDPIDVHVDLGLRHVSFVIAEQTEDRVGEPDRTVGFHDDIVRRVQPLAFEQVHQHRDGAVIFGSNDTASAMLAGNQASLAVAGVAIREVRRLAVDTHRAGFLFPLDDALVGNVAAQEVTPVADPHRPLGPAQSRLSRSTADSLSQYFSKRGSSAWIRIGYCVAGCQPGRASLSVVAVLVAVLDSSPVLVCYHCRLAAATAYARPRHTLSFRNG
jgi:hypothetical protein